MKNLIVVFNIKNLKLTNFKKPFYFLYILLLASSCSPEDNLIIEETISGLEIEYLYKPLDKKGNTYDPIEEYFLPDLQSNCDLSSIGFDDFTSNVDLNFLYGYNPPFYPIFNNSEQYGMFPSDELSVALTGLFNYDNFLPMERPPVINPVTGAPYKVTRINRFYDEYMFADPQIYDYVSDTSYYEFINGNPSSSNELRDLIACKLIEKANEIDPTAFLFDVGVRLDALLCGDCNPTVWVRVYAAWGYHY